MRGLLHIIKLILVFLYILFEEIVWENFAKPIYTFIHSLKILQRVERYIEHMSAHIIVVLFISTLAFVEVLGLSAGGLFLRGKFLLGASIYALKVPVAGFTFWLFRTAKDKLLSIGWFNFLYSTLMRIVDYIKATQSYKEIRTFVLRIKRLGKIYLYLFKKRNFRGASKMSELYKKIKHALKS